MAGAWLTVRVKDWVALGRTALAAVNVIGYVPLVPAAGVPERTPVAALKVMPVGRAPDSDRVAGGGDGETAGGAGGEGGHVGAGDGRSLVDGEREGLGGVGEDRVGGGE